MNGDEEGARDTMYRAGTSDRLTSLKDSIQTQSPFCNPTAWKPAHSFLVIALACLEDIVLLGSRASM